MMKRWMLLSAALVAGSLLLAGLASRAADKDDPKKADEEPAGKENAKGDALNSIMLAYKLADYGRNADHPSPLALITAADMLTQAGLAESDPKNVKAGDGSTPAKADSKTFLKEEAGKLLDEAEKLLAADKDMSTADANVVKGELARVRKFTKADGPKRGSAVGPLVYRMQVKPGQTDTYNVKFTKDEWARIAIRNEGGPDSRLALAAVNPKGATRATDGGHDPSIAFIPHAADDLDFKITITNKGNAPVIYQLYVN
jgi:hypothetical protein